MVGKRIKKGEVMPTPNDLVDLEEYIKGGCRKWCQTMPESVTAMYSFDDLVQEAFLYMLGRLPYYKPELSKLKTFVWNSLRNHFRFLRVKATREHKLFVKSFNHNLDTSESQRLDAMIPASDKQFEIIEENDLLEQVRKKLNEEENFVFQCFMNPPSELWKMAREKRVKTDKKRKRKTQAINPKYNDIFRYLIEIGGCTWARKVIKNLRRKVRAVLAAS